MSFAAGFQAGSGAVERGLRLRAQREEKEKAEAYQAAVAGLSQQYQAGQQLQADYGAQQQANLDAGMALASPVPDAMGAQGVQMSPVAPQAGGLTGPGAMPQAAMMTPPPATSYQDYQRDMAALAMQYGDTATGISLMGQAAAADRAAQQEAIRRSEFQQDYLLRSNQDARAQSEEERAATEADNAAKALEGKGKIDALINQGVTDRGQFDDILSEYGKYGVNVAYLGEALEASRGITRGQIEAEALQIQGDLRGITTFESLVDYYNESDSLSPGYKLELARNEETGLFDLNHFDDKGNKIDRDVASFRTKQEADVYLRQLAVDPTTAMSSLVERDNQIRTSRATAELKSAERDLEVYKTNKSYSEEQLKAVSAGINKLKDDPNYAFLPAAERAARIKEVYDGLGIAPPNTLGLAPTGEKPPTSSVEEALKAYDKQKEEEAKVDSEVETMVDLATGSGIIGYVGRATGLGYGQDQERFDVAYAAATPEQRKQVDERIAERRAQTDVTTSALLQSVPRGIGLPGPLGPIASAGSFLKNNR